MWSEGIYILQAQNLFVIWPKDTQNKKLMWSYLHCFFLILLYRYVFGPSSIIMHMCRQCARIAKKIFMLWHQTCMLCLHLSEINKKGHKHLDCSISLCTCSSRNVQDNWKHLCYCIKMYTLSSQICTFQTANLYQRCNLYHSSWLPARPTVQRLRRKLMHDKGLANVYSL